MFLGQSGLVWVQGDSSSTWLNVRMEETNGVGKGCKGKWNGDCNLCSAFTSDLPCMHLDPGVNRLGLNITSIHQTDRRPVTPDIVFPICVILWPQEEGLKKNSKTTKKKRSIQFTNTLKDQRSVLDCCLWERSLWLRKSKPKPCKSKREKRFQVNRTPLGGTEGRGRRRCGATPEGPSAQNSNTVS